MSSNRPDNNSDILIIESETESAMNLQKLVMDAGFNSCSIAHNGVIAEEIVASELCDPKLIIMSCEYFNEAVNIKAAMNIRARYNSKIILINKEKSISPIEDIIKALQPYQAINKLFKPELLAASIKRAMTIDASSANRQNYGRRFVRYSKDELIAKPKVVFAEGRSEKIAFYQDLSLGGIGFITPESVYKGDVLRVTIELNNWGGDKIWGSCLIVHSKTFSRFRYCGGELSFGEINQSNYVKFIYESAVRLHEGSMVQGFMQQGNKLSDCS